MTRYEDRVGAHRPDAHIDVDEPLPVDGKIRDLPSFVGQCARRREHRFVLDRGDDDVSSVSFVRIRGAQYGEIVRLRARTGEDDLLRSRAEKLCDVGASVLKRIVRHAPASVQGRGVRVCLVVVGEHRGDDLRRGRRHRCVIQIDCRCGISLHSFSYTDDAFLHICSHERSELSELFVRVGDFLQELRVEELRRYELL